MDIVEELKSWGHAGGDSGHLILKCDNEPAIIALRNTLGKSIGGRIIPESPPKGESQSNGEIEESCKTIRGFTKVLKDQIEDETGDKLDGKDNIIQWMIRWGAMLPSRFLVGKDGRTAYERRRGRRCNVPTERFGEKVWYKELKGKSETAGKIESGWREGLWLGHARSSNEIFVGTREGVVRAWAIRKKPYEEQWDGDLVKNMMGTPAQPNPLKASSQVPIRITFEENPDVVVVEGVGPARVEAKPRNTYIQSWMLDVYSDTLVGVRGVM